MFFYFAVDTVDNWKNINMSIKNFKSTIRWLSDAAVDAVDIKKLICQQIFFFLFLRLTPLTFVWVFYFLPYLPPQIQIPATKNTSGQIKPKTQWSAFALLLSAK